MYNISVYLCKNNRICAKKCSILPVVLLFWALKRHSPRAGIGLWAEDAIPGVFGGGGGQTIGTAPNSQETGDLEGCVQGWEDAEAGERAGAEKTTAEKATTPPTRTRKASRCYPGGRRYSIQTRQPPIKRPG